MTIEYQLDNNILLNQIPKSISKKYDYGYIRNNEVEWNGNGRRRMNYDCN